MYGLNDKRTADFGRKCLITRRLLEKGVRFIQLYSGGGHIEDTWDGHNDCIGNHTLHAGETDQPIAALMTDLKRTGLWDETLLIWGGEFGRTPTSEGVGKPGRDHNWHGFSMWLAGRGRERRTGRSARPTSWASPPSKIAATSPICTRRFCT